MPKDDGALAERIDALLPQTQCRRCGYLGCRPYANAVALGDAPIDRCPPGGRRTVAALARLLKRPVPDLDATFDAPEPRASARVDQTKCIGCTLCVAACPVDAIVGAAKLMHTVLVARCTGCALCLPPCPVDCIALEPTGSPWTRVDAERARIHVAARLARHGDPPARRVGEAPAAESAAWTDAAMRRAAIAAARARARARRAASTAVRA